MMRLNDAGIAIGMHGNKIKWKEPTRKSSVLCLAGRGNTLNGGLLERQWERAMQYDKKETGVLIVDNGATVGRVHRRVRPGRTGLRGPAVRHLPTHSPHSAHPAAAVVVLPGPPIRPPARPSLHELTRTDSGRRPHKTPGLAGERRPPWPPMRLAPGPDGPRGRPPTGGRVRGGGGGCGWGRLSGGHGPGGVAAG